MHVAYAERLRNLPIQRALFSLSLMLLGFFSVVVPNSQPTLHAVLLVFAALFALPAVRFQRKALPLLLQFLAASLVTVAFLFVGLGNGAPRAAAFQIPIIYLVAPALWMLVGFGIQRTFSFEPIANGMAYLSLLACASIIVYVTLYYSFGAEAVQFFKEGRNNVSFDSEGNTGATMHVYGALIFLCGGFFASPDVIGSRPLRIVVLGSLFIAALTSGRSALILSLGIGIAVGLAPGRRSERRILPGSRLFVNATILLIVTVVATWIARQFFTFNIGKILGFFSEELLSGGGEIRVSQFRALADGIDATDGLGAGHGIGVRNIRDSRYPWRYELVWVATIYRVGLFGSLVYALPFVVYVVLTVKSAFERGLSLIERFMLGGFVAAFAASNTNPYIEAFSFQWMYVLPLVSYWGAPEESAENPGSESDRFRELGSGRESN